MKGNNWKSGRAWLGHGSIIVLAIVESVIIYFGYLPHIVCGPNAKPDCVPSNGWGWPPSILLPVIGLITFFGTLFITNILSAKKDISNWEMRKAITASILVVYFFFLPLMLFSNASPIYKIKTDLASTEAMATSEPVVTGTPQASSDLAIKTLQGVTNTPVPSDTAEPEEASSTETPEVSTQSNESDKPSSSEITTPIGLAASITTAFTTLVGTVIGFYFVSKTVEGVAYQKFGRKEEEEE